ncbi:uncharacterized protein KGF55_005237 [Candida pseudojiufengensis]|uniref:uncharacterized protein n=1 Tax=Candida pseudojiufengensis TaxID=497109 RepID=UPI00222501D0|nr:uncharacterized protein KGF55_005237 [Candida pseudojiufengensis]KAI5959593.1 hypothetical protein KGF55_005237 [Candida pseudojiufengensis]
MVKTKLQIIVIPREYSLLSTEDINSSISKKFLHLTSPENTIKILHEEVSARYKKLYPDGPNITIINFQDQNSCDLDYEYIVEDVFENNDVVRVLVDNFFSENLELEFHPKRSREEADRASIEYNVTPTKNPKIGSVSPVSLAPPPSILSNKIPKKKFNETPGSKSRVRITSGMLEKPSTNSELPKNISSNHELKNSKSNLDSDKNKSNHISRDEKKPSNAQVAMDSKTPRITKSAIMDMYKLKAKESAQEDDLLKSLEIDTVEGHPRLSNRQRRNAGIEAAAKIKNGNQKTSPPNSTTTSLPSTRSKTRSSNPTRKTLDSDKSAYSFEPNKRPSSSNKNKKVKYYDEYKEMNLLEYISVSLDSFRDELETFRKKDSIGYNKVPSNFGSTPYYNSKAYTDPIIDCRLNLSDELTQENSESAPKAPPVLETSSTIKIDTKAPTTTQQSSSSAPKPTSQPSSNVPTPTPHTSLKLPRSSQTIKPTSIPMHNSSAKFDPKEVIEISSGSNSEAEEEKGDEKSKKYDSKLTGLINYKDLNSEANSSSIRSHVIPHPINPSNKSALASPIIGEGGPVYSRKNKNNGGKISGLLPPNYYNSVANSSSIPPQIKKHPINSNNMNASDTNNTKKNEPDSSKKSPFNFNVSSRSSNRIRVLPLEYYKAQNGHDPNSEFVARPIPPINQGNQEYDSFFVESKKTTLEVVENLFYSPENESKKRGIDKNISLPSVPAKVDGTNGNSAAFGVGDSFGARSNQNTISSKESGSPEKINNDISKTMSLSPAASISNETSSRKQSPNPLSGRGSLQLFAKKDYNKSSSGSSDENSDDDDEMEDKFAMPKKRLVASVPTNRNSPAPPNNPPISSTAHSFIPFQKMEGSQFPPNNMIPATSIKTSVPQSKIHDESIVNYANKPMVTPVKRPLLSSLMELGSRGVPEVKEVDSIKNNKEASKSNKVEEKKDGISGLSTESESESSSSSSSSSDEDDDGSNRLFLSSKKAKSTNRVKKNLFT